MNLKPFEDKEHVEKLREERDKLIESLSNYPIDANEKRFIIKKLQDITEKLIKKAQYAKDK